MISIPLCHDCYVFVAICLLFTFLPCVIVLKLELETRNEVINNILYIVLLQGIIYYLKHASLKMVLRQSIFIMIKSQSRSIQYSIYSNDLHYIIGKFSFSDVIAVQVRERNNRLNFKGILVRVTSGM